MISNLWLYYSMLFLLKLLNTNQMNQFRLPFPTGISPKQSIPVLEPPALLSSASAMRGYFKQEVYKQKYKVKVLSVREHR